MPNAIVKKLTPVLMVDAIEPCLPLWTERLGWTKTAEAPDGDKIGFVILARDRDPETNLVWKDTVLVRAGQTVDILLDVTNPGLWMAHCHIAEHTESGMMFSFMVHPSPPRTL